MKRAFSGGRNVENSKYCTDFIVWTGALAADDVAATAGAHARTIRRFRHRPQARRRAWQVTGDDVVYGQVGDTELRGYLARPVDAGPGTPGLIVIHEWWGLNDNIRQAAERLAGEGYVALAIDLYNGQSASIPKEAIKLMNGLMADTDGADENLRQAHRYLDEELGAPARRFDRLVSRRSLVTAHRRIVTRPARCGRHVLRHGDDRRN